MDNASIHTDRFESMIEEIGGRVWRMPPLCVQALALDNGGFGLLTRYMSANADELSRMSVPEAMGKALRACCSPNAARWCFYNCGYNYYSTD